MDKEKLRRQVILHKTIDKVVSEHPEHYRKQVGAKKDASIDEIQRRVKLSFAKAKVEKRKPILKFHKEGLRQKLKEENKGPITKLNDAFIKAAASKILKNKEK